jgi:CBS domain-containing protein
MPVSDFCNRDVVTIGAEASVREAAELMRTLHVGDLVVVESRDEQRVPIGVVTDRDIVVEILAEDVNPRDVAVGDFMSGQIVTASEDDDIMDVIELMRTEGVRRVPVVDGGGALVGIVAVDDLIDSLAEMLHGISGVVRRERYKEEESRP